MHPSPPIKTNNILTGNEPDEVKDMYLNHTPSADFVYGQQSQSSWMRL
jgi:hypothetical protein